MIDEFEQKIAEFYGAPYGVATDSCTHAIELCLRYFGFESMTSPVRTYLSVPMLAQKLGIPLQWDIEIWTDYYYIRDFERKINDKIIDAAVYWKENGYVANTCMCLSFQYQKQLSLSKGGMILTDDKNVYYDLKKLSHDGRIPNVPWRSQNIKSFGYHYNMTIETAELGLQKFESAKCSELKIWKYHDWPDLRNMDIFK